VFERAKSDYRSLELQNIGAEFFSFLMGYYFPSEKLKDLDIRTVIDKLKVMDRDASRMLDPDKAKDQKVKYKFSPIETYQMRMFHSTKKDKEFKESKSAVYTSDDEESMLKMISDLNTEIMNGRMYDKTQL